MSTADNKELLQAIKDVTHLLRAFDNSTQEFKQQYFTFPRKMKISQYRTFAYPEGSRPSIKTLQRRCEDGEIIAKCEGGIWYVLLDREGNNTGNTVVNAILNS